MVPAGMLDWEQFGELGVDGDEAVIDARRKAGGCICDPIPG